MGRLSVCLAALACACYDPPSDSCTIRCTPGVANNCPDGLACNNAGLCSTDGASCTGPTIDFTHVGVGSRHACGLATNGDIWCWGANDYAQLGDGLAISDIRPTPGKVAGGPYTHLTVGSEHACAMSAGKVICWGNNDEGQVRGAMGGTFAIPTEVLAGDAPVFEHISAGGWHTCGLASGQLWCWGHRDFTNGAGASQATRIGTLDDWTSISAGYDHACGISASMGVMCFGANDRGQLAQSNTSMIYTQPVAPLGAPSQVPLELVAGDEVTCVIYGNAGATMGELWCWGSNAADMSIIDGSGIDRGTATRVGDDADWTLIALGHQIACGNRAGRTYCWGTSYDGGIGGGFWNDARLTVDVARDVGSAFEQLALQPSSHNGDDVDIACGRRGTDVFCWGNDSYGQLAQGTVSRHALAIEVPAQGDTWAGVVAGHYHTCGTNAQGAPFCWGATTYGAVNAGISLGDSAPCVAGEVCDIPRPTAAPSPVTRADEMIAGDHYTCMRDGGTVRCWGSNFRGVSGASGSGASVRSVIAPNAATWTRIMGGETGNCGLTSANDLACWGFIAGTTQQTPVVYNDTALQNLATIQFGEGFGCGATNAKARVCWGNNTSGELGNGTTTTVTTPVALDIGTIEHISAHDRLACAATTSGGVRCWGSNDFNEAGHPTRSQNVLSPNEVRSAAGSLTGCTKVAASESFGCALCSGDVYCWGRNYAGELGRAALPYSLPTHLAELVSLPSELTFVELTVGRYHGCARTGEGRLFCWGNGVHGQLGDGGQSRNIPTQIAP